VNSRDLIITICLFVSAVSASVSVGVLLGTYGPAMVERAMARLTDSIGPSPEFMEWAESPEGQRAAEALLVLGGLGISASDCAASHESHGRPATLFPVPNPPAPEA